MEESGGLAGREAWGSGKLLEPPLCGGLWEAKGVGPGGWVPGQGWPNAGGLVAEQWEGSNSVALRWMAWGVGPRKREPNGN